MTEGIEIERLRSAEADEFPAIAALELVAWCKRVPEAESVDAKAHRLKAEFHEQQPNSRAMVIAGRSRDLVRAGQSRPLISTALKSIVLTITD